MTQPVPDNATDRLLEYENTIKQLRADRLTVSKENAEGATFEELQIQRLKLNDIDTALMKVIRERNIYYSQLYSINYFSFDTRLV